MERGIKNTQRGLPLNLYNIHVILHQQAHPNHPNLQSFFGKSVRKNQQEASFIMLY